MNAAASDRPDLGRCPCGGAYEARSVEVNMTVRDQPLVLDGIRQLACPECGSRVYAVATLELLERAMSDRPAAAPREVGRR